MIYIYEWYKASSLRKLKRKSIPVMTEHIDTKFHQVKHAIRLLTTKFDKIMELRLRQLVNDLIRTINMKFPMHKSKAPFISQNTAQNLAEKLWSFDPNGRGRGYRNRSVIVRKAAALHLLLSVYAGARWNDVQELHWSDITFANQPHGQFMQIKLRRSKNNELNEQPQCYTYAKMENGPVTSCAIRLLEEYRAIQGNPTHGRIFQGFSGKSLLRAVRLMSKELGVQVPTGHSGK